MKKPSQKPYNMFDPAANAPRRHPVFRAVRGGVRLVLPRYQVIRETPLPQGPAIYVANHAKALGPVAMAALFDEKVRPWVISNMCRMKTAPDWVRRDFFHAKKPLWKGCVRLLSYPIAWILLGLFKGTEAIPSYFDRNAIYTVSKSVRALCEEQNVALFPENRTPFSEYNEDFSSGFVAIARRYYRETKQTVPFYPVYVSGSDHTIRVGPPMWLDPEADYPTARKELAAGLRNEVTRMAREVGGPPEYSVN